MEGCLRAGRRLSRRKAQEGPGDIGWAAVRLRHEGQCEQAPSRPRRSVVTGETRAAHPGPRPSPAKGAGGEGTPSAAPPQEGWTGSSQPDQGLGHCWPSPTGIQSYSAPTGTAHWLSVTQRSGRSPVQGQVRARSLRGATSPCFSLTAIFRSRPLSPPPLCLNTNKPVRPFLKKRLANTHETQTPGRARYRTHELARAAAHGAGAGRSGTHRVSWLPVRPPLQRQRDGCQRQPGAPRQATSSSPPLRPPPGTALPPAAPAG